jgi:hypothetical protein
MLTVLMRLRLRLERKQELLPVVSLTLPTTIGSCLGLDLGSKITRMQMVMELKKIMLPACRKSSSTETFPVVSSLLVVYCLSPCHAQGV